MHGSSLCAFPSGRGSMQCVELYPESRDAHRVPPTRRRRSITSTFLSTFNKEKLAIEQTVESVNNATRQINSLMQESQTAFSPDELDKVSAKLADCVKRAGGDAQRGKRLLDELKKRSDELQSSNPRSDRLQPYKSQYMRLCKMYVDAMKEHQKSKVRRVMARRRALARARLCPLAL